MARRRQVRRPDQISPWPFVGMALMGATAFLYLYSAVVVPWYVFVLLLLIWLVLFVLCTRWWTLHPRRLPAVAGVAVVIWFLTLVGGAAVFGWS